MNATPDAALAVAALALIGVLVTALVAAYNARKRGALDRELTELKEQLAATNAGQLAEKQANLEAGLAQVKGRLDRANAEKLADQQAEHSQRLQDIEFAHSKSLKDLEAQLEDLRVKDERRHEQEKLVSRYREPLARAAYDLQSRLYNILEQQFIEAYYTNGSERERSYAVDNSVFLVAQYFAWTEIIRREIQFLDLGADIENRELARLQDELYSLWQTDLFGTLYRVFAGEQRAIGERMIREGPRGPECMGYASFLEQNTKANDPLIEALRADTRRLAHSSEARARLIALQNALIDLLAFLDPQYVRFPERSRTKVPAS
jgi:hypothetical protein